MATTVMTPSPSAQELAASHIESNLSSSGNSSNGIKFVPYDKSSHQKTEVEECKNKFRQFRMKNRDNQNGGNDASSGRVVDLGANTRRYSHKSDGNVEAQGSDWQANGQGYGQNYGHNHVQKHGQNHVQNLGQNQVKNNEQKHRHNHGQNHGQTQPPAGGNLQRYRHAAGNGSNSQRSNHGPREVYGVNTRDNNYGRRNSGSGSIKGRNLPPRLQRQRSANGGGVDHETSQRKHSNGEHYSGGDYSRVENSSRRENFRRDNSKRSHHAPRNEYARPNANHLDGNNMKPPFSFDPRLPFPNPITGMFSPASLDDSWMNTPMNQIFDGYNHHKHGQQWGMKDFVKDGHEKRNKEEESKNVKNSEKQKSSTQNGAVKNPQEPMFSMEQMQQFYVGWSYMMQQQQNMQAMQNMQSMYAMQHQMASSKSMEQMAQKEQLASSSKKHQKSSTSKTSGLPPPGFSTNDRDSPNLSDVTRSSNSTLPSELNECAVQEAMSSTAKKPVNMISSLNYARNPHPNSPYHRKTANIPNPFLNQSNKPCNDQSVLDLCLEKHDRYPVEKKKIQEKNRKDDHFGVTFDTARNKVLYEERNLFSDKSVPEENHFKNLNISDPNYSFNNASFHNSNGFNNASSLTNASGLNPTSSFNNASNNNSSFVQNSSLATNSNLFGSSSIFNKSNDASGNKSAFSNELRTSGYVTNDTSKHSTSNFLLNESEPALKIGDEFKYSRGAREQSDTSAEENLRGILLPGLRQSLGKPECLGDRWQQKSVHQAYMQPMPQDH